MFHNFKNLFQLFEGFLGLFMSNQYHQAVMKEVIGFAHVFVHSKVCELCIHSFWLIAVLLLQHITTCMTLHACSLLHVLARICVMFCYEYDLFTPGLEQ